LEQEIWLVQHDVPYDWAQEGIALLRNQAGIELNFVLQSGRVRFKGCAKWLDWMPWQVLAWVKGNSQSKSPDQEHLSFGPKTSVELGPA
jgi:hypothetical protein